MFKVCTLLAAVVIAASVPASSEAKNPRGCKRTNVRSANPQGSVLVQPATRAATGTAVPLIPGQSTVPVVVFGGPQAATGAATGMSTAEDGTVVPSITSEAAPQAARSRSGKKRARRRTSAVIDLPSSPDAGALAAASSC